MTKNNVDINELIQELYKVPESVFDRKRTKTSHFLLNTIFPGSSLTATEYFVNAFLDDAEYSHNIQRAIFLLFKVSPKDNKWLLISQRLRTKVEYITEYFSGLQDGKHLLVMIFQIPEKYSLEYELFKQGRYSEFSPAYKKLFNRYAQDSKAQVVESTIWRVLHKSVDLKKELEKFFTVREKAAYVFEPTDELWGIPEDKFEIYRFKTEK